MHIEEYDNDDHYGVLIEWLKARQISPKAAENLPEIGIVAFKNEVPVAMAFLRQAEGGFGIFEGLCSNPKAPPEIRDKAIDLLIEDLIKISKEFEIHMILAWSLDNNTLTRSLRHGFEKSQNSIITLDLNSTSSVH